MELDLSWKNNVNENRNDWEWTNSVGVLRGKLRGVTYCLCMHVCVHGSSVQTSVDT